MLLVRGLIVALFLTSLSGCSYLLMEPPPPQHARLDSFQCRTSRGTPTLDVIFGFGQSLGAIALLAIAADASEDSRNQAIGYAIPSAVTAAVAFGSAAYGFGAAEECNAALEQLAVRQQHAREQAIIVEQVTLRRLHTQTRQEALETNAPARQAPPPSTLPAPAQPTP